MSHWSFWDWIAYGCLGIAAFGLAIGTIWKEYPHMFQSWWPTFLSSPKWSFLPAIFFVIATLIFIFRAVAPSATSKSAGPVQSVAAALIEKSELRMHSYGDDRDPTRLSDVNVWRWYYLRTAFIGIDKESGNVVKRVSPTLFVSFDSPTKVGTLAVRSSDFKLPQYEVKQFTNRFAIIWFSDELPAGEFVVETY
jgi:hypothetical protein